MALQALKGHLAFFASQGPSPAPPAGGGGLAVEGLFASAGAVSSVKLQCLSRAHIPAWVTAGQGSAFSLPSSTSEWALRTLNTFHSPEEEFL